MGNGESRTEDGHLTGRRISPQRLELRIEKADRTLCGAQILWSLPEYVVYMEGEHPWTTSGDTGRCTLENTGLVQTKNGQAL